MENLEKNVVVISTEEYADLGEYRYAFDLLKDDNRKLKRMAIQNAIDNYDIERYELKDLLDVESYMFPINRTHLYALLDAGITTNEILNVIKRKKEDLEHAKKKEEESDD